MTRHDTVVHQGLRSLQRIPCNGCRTLCAIRQACLCREVHECARAQLCGQRLENRVRPLPRIKPRRWRDARVATHQSVSAPHMGEQMTSRIEGEQ